MTYLAGAAPENLLTELEDHMRRILNKEKNPMSSFLEGVLKDVIKERLEEVAAENMKKGMEKGIKIGEEKGRREGVKKGKREGVKEEIEQVVKKMVAEGFDEKIISRVTGLTLGEVRKQRGETGSEIS